MMLNSQKPLSSRFSKATKFAASAAFLACVTVGAIGSSVAAPTASLKAGYTDVVLDTGFTSALASLNVTLGLLPRTYSNRGQVFFPITTGSVDLANAKGEISHVGGITLTAGATRVELSDFIIDTIEPGKPVLTGVVVVNDSIVDRIPLFDITLPAGLTLPLAPKGRTLALDNAGLKLTEAAAGALNGVFKITALKGGLTIGQASVKAFTRRDH